MRISESTPQALTCDVLVVGGGFAGRTAARHVGTQGFSVVLVDAKTYFEFTPSVPRCIVCPDAIANSARPHSDAERKLHPGRNVSTVHGVVAELTDGSAFVNVASGLPIQRGTLSVNFRYCIWAAGSGYDDPIHPNGATLSSIRDRKGDMSSWLEKLKTSRSVLVLGGGLVGVEMAAELAEIQKRYARSEMRLLFPKIILASSGDRLLPRLPRRAGMLAEQFLLSRGVKRVTRRLRREGEAEGRRCVANPESLSREHVYVAADGSGLRVSADVVFDCTGSRRNKRGDALRAYASSCADSAVFPGRAGMVRVRKTLQLYGSDNVFVAGDAGAVDHELLLEHEGGLGGEKTAYAAVEGGRLAAQNVTQLLRAGAATDMRAGPLQLRRYPGDAFGGPFPRMFAVGLGKWDGVLCVGPLVLGGPVVALTKTVIEFMSVRAVSRGGFVESVWTSTERLLYGVVQALSAAGRWYESSPLPTRLQARLSAR
jgi:apoptosis-inducing factor 2